MMLCSLTLLLADSMHQKLIVYSDKSAKNAQANLSKLKVYFIENPNIRMLNEANDFKLGLETLGSYTMVVVKPIMSRHVKNRLLLELTPVFPDIFVLDDTSADTIDHHPSMSTSQQNHSMREERSKTLIETVGLQWLALLILSLLGLVLSVLKRRKLLSLGERQKKLDMDQQKIEKEIHNLGKHHYV